MDHFPVFPHWEEEEEEDEEEDKQNILSPVFLTYMTQ